MQALLYCHKWQCKFFTSTPAANAPSNRLLPAWHANVVSSPDGALNVTLWLATRQATSLRGARVAAEVLALLQAAVWHLIAADMVAGLGGKRPSGSRRGELEWQVQIFAS